MVVRALARAAGLTGPQLTDAAGVPGVCAPTLRAERRAAVLRFARNRGWRRAKP